MQIPNDGLYYLPLAVVEREFSQETWSSDKVAFFQFSNLNLFQAGHADRPHIKSVHIAPPFFAFGHPQISSS